MSRLVKVDVAVVGAGPGGLAAAFKITRRGKSVALIDENASFGGQIWRGESANPKSEASGWFQSIDTKGLTWLPGHTVVDAQEGELQLVNGGGEPARVQCGSIVLATGARELFLPFPGWTLPGVAGVGGLQALSKSGLQLKGKRVVVAGTGPLLLAAARYFAKAGAEIHVFEQAPFSSLIKMGAALTALPDKAVEAMGYLPLLTKVRAGRWVLMATGESKIQSVIITDGRKEQEIACDYLACAYGLIPNTELATLLGCRIEGGFVQVDQCQRTSLKSVFAVGELTGIAGLQSAIVEGERAGYYASGGTDYPKELNAAVRRFARMTGLIESHFALRPELKQLATPETFVCRCEDVRLRDLTAFRDSREAKLHTRCGMGACQGRVCGPATAFLFGWKEGTIRPPLKPVQIGSLCTDELKQGDLD